MKIFNRNSPSDVLKVIPLGGIGDVTKNMYVYEYKNDIIIIDCGVGFPEEGMLGIDLVIPDISYLKDKKSKIRGIIITHAHDDHIGGLPYLWPELDVPIYSQKLSCGFIKGKFTEHNLPKDKINTLKIDDTIKLGEFQISFYQVAHSIPDSTGIIIKTPIGTLIHQSDFKIDWSPVNGQVTDVNKLAQAGADGVLMMSIDCLRVEKQGYTPTERAIEPTFAEIEKKSPHKMLITMTSSNLTRIQQAINVAEKSGRKLALAGRSLESNVQTARDLGYLTIPQDLLVEQEQIKRVPENKLMILIAGSQGQPGSALSRAANDDHKHIHLGAGDSVVFSADPIPSTMSAQGGLIDTLSLKGCDVYYSAVTPNLHVSGHAAQEELKMMINLAKPKYILPIGGNFRHMKAFSTMAQTLGYKSDQIMLIQNGDVIEVSPQKAEVKGFVEVSNVYIDGLGVGDVGQVVLRDRQVLAGDGVVVVVVTINRKTGELMGEPDLISRGFVYEKGSEGLLEAGTDIVKGVIKNIHPEQRAADWRYIRKSIEESLEKYFYQKTNRRPMILSVVVDL